MAVSETIRVGRIVTCGPISVVRRMLIPTAMENPCIGDHCASQRRRGNHEDDDSVLHLKSSF